MARLWRFDISNHQKWKIWVSRSYISDWSWQLWFFLSKIDREFSLFFLKLSSLLKSNKLKLKRILKYFSIDEKIGRKKPCQVRCLLWFTTCGERFLGISHWQKTERTLKENKLGTIHLRRRQIFTSFDPYSKVIYTKYSKHWPYTVAHTIDCLFRKC